MARPVTITDEQILEAARAVFVRDGINGTTKDIARMAKTSEGTLFRRFPTKEALLVAAVFHPPPPAWVRELDGLTGQGDVYANLLHIAEGMVDFAREMFPLVMATKARRLDEESLTSEDTKSPALRDRRRLAHYLQQEMEHGRLRPCSAEAVSRLLFGACLNLVMDQRPESKCRPAEDWKRSIAEIVDTLWAGIRPIDANASEDLSF